MQEWENRAYLKIKSKLCFGNNKRWCWMIICAWLCKVLWRVRTMNLVLYRTAKDPNSCKSLSQMSHHFKKKPHSWHLDFLATTLVCLVQITPHAEKQWLTPYSMFSFPFSKTFHSLMPGESNVLNKERNGSIRPRWWDLTLQSTKSWNHSQTQMAKWGFNTKPWKGSKRSEEHFLLTLTSLRISGLRQEGNGDKK